MTGVEKDAGTWKEFDTGKCGQKRMAEPQESIEGEEAKEREGSMHSKCCDHHYLKCSKKIKIKNSDAYVNLY